MARQRSPTSLLALNGGLAINPGRYADRAAEPASNGPVGDAPVEFDDTRKALWAEVVSLVPDGVLQKSDRLIVELICALLFDLRTGQATMATVSQLRMSLASLGMTPADRSRVSAVPTANIDDPLQFLR